MDTNSANFDNEHFRYFISMAVQGKMPFPPLTTIFDDLTPTLEKSKQLNKVLLEEIQRLATRLPIHENPKSPESNLAINQRGEIENETESFSTADNFDYENDLSEDRIENNYDDTNQERNFDEDAIEETETATFYVKDCMICGERFETIDAYEIHAKIHEISKDEENGKSVQSEAKQNLNEFKTCLKPFKAKKGLTSHRLIHTTIKKPLQCNYCPKSFVSKEGLKIHTRFHTGEKPYRCKSCDKNFATLILMRVHERIHSGKSMFVCNYCDKQFVQSGNLKTHERTHTGEKPYECVNCFKCFANSGTLKKHVRTHFM